MTAFGAALRVVRLGLAAYGLARRQVGRQATKADMIDQHYGVGACARADSRKEWAQAKREPAPTSRIVMASPSRARDRSPRGNGDHGGGGAGPDERQQHGHHLL